MANRNRLAPQYLPFWPTTVQKKSGAVSSSTVHEDRNRTVVMAKTTMPPLIVSRLLTMAA